MALIDKKYHDLLLDILQHGFKYKDPNRKDTIRTQIQSYTLVHNFEDGFPAITTKKLAWKSVVGELLWFLRGSKDIRELWKDNIYIWDKDWLNYTDWFIKDNYGTKEELLSGKCKDYIYELGPIYGTQWRNFTGRVDIKLKDSAIIHNSERIYDETIYNYVDQISNLIKGLKETPMGTRHIVTAWNPAELDDMALPPCHWSFEILVRPLSPIEIVDIAKKEDKWVDIIPENKTLHEVQKNFKNYAFTLKWHQRSVDTFLGLPFNIASYALLAHIIGKMTNMIPEGIIGDLSNVHIYDNHINAVKKQLNRDVNKYNNCELLIDPKAEKDFKFKKTIDLALDNIDIWQFQLKNYNNYPSIKAEMLAYNK